jgi:hypothetical protein
MHTITLIMLRLDLYCARTSQHICYHTAKSREDLLRLYNMYKKIKGLRIEMG